MPQDKLPPLNFGEQLPPLDFEDKLPPLNFGEKSAPKSKYHIPTEKDYLTGSLVGDFLTQRPLPPEGGKNPIVRALGGAGETIQGGVDRALEQAMPTKGRAAETATKMVAFWGSPDKLAPLQTPDYWKTMGKNLTDFPRRMLDMAAPVAELGAQAVKWIAGGEKPFSGGAPTGEQVKAAGKSTADFLIGAVPFVGEMAAKLIENPVDTIRDYPGEVVTLAGLPWAKKGIKRLGERVRRGGPFTASEIKSAVDEAPDLIKNAPKEPTTLPESVPEIVVPETLPEPVVPPSDRQTIVPSIAPVQSTVQSDPLLSAIEAKVSARKTLAPGEIKYLQDKGMFTEAPPSSPAEGGIERATIAGPTSPSVAPGRTSSVKGMLLKDMAEAKSGPMALFRELVFEQERDNPKFADKMRELVGQGEGAKPESTLRERIVAAFESRPEGPMGAGKESIRISDIKKALPDVKLADIHNELLALQKDRLGVLSPIDNPKWMTAEDRAAELSLGKEKRHLFTPTAPKKGPNLGLSMKWVTPEEARKIAGLQKLEKDIGLPEEPAPRTFMDDPGPQPYATPTDRPLEVAYQSKKTSMPIYKHEMEEMMAGKGDLPRTKGDFSYTNMIYVFQWSPLLKKMLYDQMKVAENNVARRQSIAEGLIKSWRRESEVNTRKLAAYSYYQQKGGPEALKAMGIAEEPKLSKSETWIYDNTRAMLEGLFEEVNKARELAGLDPIKKIDNYFTFAANIRELQEMGFNVFKDNADTLRSHIQTPPWQYTKRSKGVYPLNLDFFGVLTNYLRQTHELVEKGPVIAKGRTFLRDFEITGSDGKAKPWSFYDNYPNLWRHVTNWLDFNVGQKMPQGLPESHARIASAMSRNVAGSLLAGTATSLLKQMSSLRNTYTEIGPRYTAEGLIRLVSESERTRAYRTSNVLRSRIFEAAYEDVNAPPFSRAYRKAKGKLIEGGLFPLKWLDLKMAEATWLGAEQLGMRRGLKGNELKVFADDTVNMTQASAAKSDVAPIQRTSMGRLLTSLQTYVIGDFNYLRSRVLHVGKLKEPASRLMTSKDIGTYVLATLLINSLYEAAGISSPLPDPVGVAAKGIVRGDNWKKIATDTVKETASIFPVIGGPIRYSTERRAGYPAPFQLVGDTLNLVARLGTAISKGDFSKIKTDDLTIVGKWFGVPGTSQAAKIIRGAKRGDTVWQMIVGKGQEAMNASKKKVVPFSGWGR